MPARAPCAVLLVRSPHAQLAGAVPPRWSALTTCPAEAQDFFFYALSTLLPARKARPTPAASI
jgi:hypothetical protein